MASLMENLLTILEEENSEYERLVELSAGNRMLQAGLLIWKIKEKK